VTFYPRDQVVIAIETLDRREGRLRRRCILSADRSEEAFFEDEVDGPAQRLGSGEGISVGVFEEGPEALRGLRQGKGERTFRRLGTIVEVRPNEAEKVVVENLPGPARPDAGTHTYEHNPDRRGRAEGPGSEYAIQDLGGRPRFMEQEFEEFTVRRQVAQRGQERGTELGLQGKAFEDGRRTTIVHLPARHQALEDVDLVVLGGTGQLEEEIDNLGIGTQPTELDHSKAEPWIVEAVVEVTQQGEPQGEPGLLDAIEQGESLDEELAPTELFEELVPSSFVLDLGQGPIAPVFIGNVLLEEVEHRGEDVDATQLSHEPSRARTHQRIFFRIVQDRSQDLIQPFEVLHGERVRLGPGLEHAQTLQAGAAFSRLSEEVQEEEVEVFVLEFGQGEHGGSLQSPGGQREETSIEG